MDTNEQLFLLFRTLVDLSPRAQSRALRGLREASPTLARRVRVLLLGDEARTFRQPMVTYEDDLTGASFDGFHVLHSLGSGGMGNVYLAQVDGGAHVALKVLREPALAPAFTHERQVHARMSHPGIPRYLGQGNTPAGAPYFAMEWVRGLGWNAYRVAAPAGARERLSLFRALCQAVEHVHSREVVHGDLKPGNVLVRETGAPVLIDFGIARKLDSEELSWAGWPPCSWALTPAYAAPEQHLGEPVDARTDVHALGVMLFELATGFHPFEGRADTALTLASWVCSGPRIAPSSAIGKAPWTHARGSDAARIVCDEWPWPQLDHLACRAMAIDPTQRHPSVGHLIGEVDQVLGLLGHTSGGGRAAAAGRTGVPWASTRLLRGFVAAASCLARGSMRL